MDSIQSFGYDVQSLGSMESLQGRLNPQKSSEFVHVPYISINSNTGSNVGASRNGQEVSRVVQIPLAISTLYSNLEQALDSLSRALNNPNLVSIDEVSTRDKEILALKDQVGKITTHWERAINVMDKWTTYREERHQQRLSPDKTVA